MVSCGTAPRNVWTWTDGSSYGTDVLGYEGSIELNELWQSTGITPSNIALGMPASTTLSNSFGREISSITDGVTDSGEFSSYSLNGDFVIRFTSAARNETVTYDLTKVVVYWSGWWGAGTNSFEILLTSGGTTTSVYSTTTAGRTQDRVDTIDLVALRYRAGCRRYHLEVQRSHRQRLRIV